VPTAFGVVALVGLFTLPFTLFASAEELSGGCSASVNGRTPTSMTKNDPLVVGEGDVVSAEGTAPGGSAEGESVTTVTVSGVEGVVGFSSETRAGSGVAWGGEVSVDDYLKWGVGLYLVEAEAVGSGWSCSASGYVKLEGNPLSKPIGQAAAGLAAVGAVGAALSARPRRSPMLQELQKSFGQDVDKAVAQATVPGADATYVPPKWTSPDIKGEAAVVAGCLFFLFPALFLGAKAAAVVAVPLQRGRIWVHGHVVLGAISGLVAGVGVAVLGQQYAIWPLTPMTAFGIPVWFATVCGVRAFIGRPWKVEFRIRHDSTFSATETPPPPPPMPTS
jgi:hypothetical protein